MPNLFSLPFEIQTAILSFALPFTPQEHFAPFLALHGRFPKALIGFIPCHIDHALILAKAKLFATGVLVAVLRQNITMLISNIERLSPGVHLSFALVQPLRLWEGIDKLRKFEQERVEYQEFLMGVPDDKLDELVVRGRRSWWPHTRHQAERYIAYGD
jgi:hypothetical protein